MSLYAELFGNTALASLNADLLFASGVGIRGGLLLDTDAYSDGEPPTALIVGTLNYFIGRGQHKLELGAGVLFGQDGRMLLGEMGIDLPAPTGTIGYRLQPGFHNTVFRMGFTPIWSRGKVVPRAGISFGWQFP